MRKLHSTGGFWLVLGALLLAASLRLLFWFLVACVVHELGHVAMVRALGGRVGCFCLTGTGAVIRPRRERLFSYWEECLVALSGPMASFLLAILAGAWGAQFGSPDAYLLTGLSLALGLFNLLPMGPLDGGRTVKAILAWLTGPDRGDQLSGVLSKTVAAALTGAGLWWFLQGGNFTLLLFALWLLLRRERREGRSFFHSKR